VVGQIAQFPIRIVAIPENVTDVAIGKALRTNGIETFQGVSFEALFWNLFRFFSQSACVFF